MKGSICGKEFIGLNRCCENRECRAIDTESDKKAQEVIKNVFKWINDSFKKDKVNIVTKSPNYIWASEISKAITEVREETRAKILKEVKEAQVKSRIGKCMLSCCNCPKLMLQEIERISSH